MSDPGLSWDVFVAPSKPVVTSDLPSDLPKRMWSPVSATLIHGKHDAVLVDPLMTVEESRAIQLDRCDAVSISRFDGSGQSVVLQGRWELIAESGEEASLGMREISVTEKTTVMTPWSPRCRGRSSGSVRRWPTPSRQRRRWRKAP
jgi:hypothetical protein